MIVLGIDPGSVVAGWALLEVKGSKTRYLSSGVLKFDSKRDFLNRLKEIKLKFSALILELKPDEVALESLIFVKNPMSLIKLSQARGVIISTFIDQLEDKVFEYAPNLIKSSAVGYGHADKESVRKFLDMTLGKREYATHDESDAVAVALCHILHRNSHAVKNTGKKIKKSSGSSMKASLAHKIGTL